MQVFHLLCSENNGLNIFEYIRYNQTLWNVGKCKENLTTKESTVEKLHCQKLWFKMCRNPPIWDIKDGLFVLFTAHGARLLDGRWYGFLSIVVHISGIAIKFELHNVSNNNYYLSYYLDSHKSWGCVITGSAAWE